MGYRPISGTAVQYQKNASETASGFYLKGFQANSATPLSMATDSTVGTLLVKCALNLEGYPISNPSDQTTDFIPYFNQKYKLSLFPTEADADANTNAIFTIDNIEGIFDASDIEYTSTSTVEDKLNNLDVDDYVELRGTTSSKLADGDSIRVTDDGIGGTFIVKTGPVTDNSSTLIVFTDDSDRHAERLPTTWDIGWSDAVMDGSTDDQAVIQSFVELVETLGGGFIYCNPNNTIALGSAITLGASGVEVFIGSGGKNGVRFKALSAFTGGMFIELAGGLNGVELEGFDFATVDHNAVEVGNGGVTNPLVHNERILNIGGWYKLIHTNYEYDNGVFDMITSNVTVGHSVMDMITGGSFAPAASPQFTRLSLRNPDATRAVGQQKKSGLILGSSQGALVSGLISNFDKCFDSAGTNKQLSIERFEAFDLRSTGANDLWESAWAATTAYSLNDYIKPTADNANGHFYIVTTAGTSDGSEPTWPTADSGTVSDGTVVWTEVGESVQILITASDQQVEISATETQAGIVALKNESNANIEITSSRFTGETMSILNTSGSSCSIQADNCLFSGDIELNGTMKFIGSMNNIVNETLGQVPDHEITSFSNVNYSFASGNGPNFALTARAGASSQVLDDYAEGTWTPTVTDGTNLTSAAIVTARYIKIGTLVFCEIEGTVTVGSTSTDSTFKFTVPFNMIGGTTSAPAGMIYTPWGGVGMGLIRDTTGGNATEVSLSVPSTFVNATGSQTFSGGFTYVSV